MENGCAIRASVGAGGANQVIDVFTIQSLLNVARGTMGQRPIGVDGIVGNETTGAITDFQRKAFGWADGRIDPRGETLNRLNQTFTRAPLRNPKTYRWGKRFSVAVGEDGRIFVNAADWLTKYSAAINNDFLHQNDFARPAAGGGLERIRNPNLIRAGETLYHIPTYLKFNKPANNPLPPPPPVSDTEKEKNLERAFKQQYKVPGDYGNVAKSIAKAVSGASDIADKIAVFFEFAEGLSDALGLIAVPLETIKRTLDFLNASDLDYRIYGLRAVAYAMTAYAFGDVELARSREHYRRLYEFDHRPDKMERLDRTWKQAWRQVTDEMHSIAAEKGGDLIWRAALRGIGDENAQKLCRVIMEKKLASWLEAGLPRQAWENGYDIKYPD